MFQSTRPRGARPAAMPASFSNSAVSIHAPAWGATTGDDPCVDGNCRFNPRARVGRDYEGE